MSVLIAGIFIPDTFDPNTEEAISGQMIACSALIKVLMEDKLLREAPLPSDIESMCEGVISKLTIQDSGEFYIENSSIGVSYVFSPVISETGINWLCSARPKSLVPEACI